MPPVLRFNLKAGLLKVDCSDIQLLLAEGALNLDSSRGYSFIKSAFDLFRLFFVLSASVINCYPSLIESNFFSSQSSPSISSFSHMNWTTLGI